MFGLQKPRTLEKFRECRLKNAGRGLRAMAHKEDSMLLVHLEKSKKEKVHGEKLRVLHGATVDHTKSALLDKNRLLYNLSNRILDENEMKLLCRGWKFCECNNIFIYLIEIGSEELVKQLARIQQERIRSTLPKIIDELRTQIQLKQIELDKLPSALTTESECLVRFGKLIKMYRELIFARVTGVYNNDLSMIMVDITLIK
ncbi:unnamed protein product [Didymodactylos carnosus]|uniref:Uncharacterized protein n=1 Tax=Didymodactylos carnosus TaxID=1234261 RepID=A0A814PAZ1_9BILA|nr:unnamed protein product [Didymodactylos carnosus]CAF3866183.1 unnamed protein product [Didymodactylos carnosus]